MVRQKGSFQSGKVPDDYSEGQIVDGDIVCRGPDINGNPVIMLVSSSISRSQCTEQLAVGVATSDAPFDTMNPDKGFGSADDANTWGGGVAASASKAVTRHREVSFVTDEQKWVQVGTGSGTIADVTGSGADNFHTKIGDLVRPYQFTAVDSITGRHSGVRYWEPEGTVATTSTTWVTASDLWADEYAALTVSTIINDTTLMPATARKVFVEVELIQTSSVDQDFCFLADSQANLATAALRNEVYSNGDAATDETHKLFLVKLDANGALHMSASGGDTGTSASVKLKGYVDDERVPLGQIVDKKVCENDDDEYWAEVLVDLDRGF